MTEAETVEAAVAALDQTTVQGKCTRQYALTANRKLKFLSSHPVTDLYIAGNVSRTTDLKDTNYFV
jgi:hypothetical protein